MRDELPRRRRLDPAELSPELRADALNLAGRRPEHWLCPVCGAVVADEDLVGPYPPWHLHHGRSVDLIPRAAL